MAEDQKTEDRYRQLQMIQQQAEQIAEYVQKLQMQLQEIDNSLEALQELKNTAINTEILAPVANGIFLKASLQDNQKLVVNVGAEVTVEKKRRSRKMFQKRKVSCKNYRNMYAECIRKWARHNNVWQTQGKTETSSINLF